MVSTLGQGTALVALGIAGFLFSAYVVFVIGQIGQKQNGQIHYKSSKKS